LIKRSKAKGINGSEWIFKNQVGSAIDIRNWRKQIFYKTIAKAGLDKIRIHDLRHMYASLLIEAGESLAYIRDQLGHHSISFTVDIYGHLTPGGNKDAVDRLDDGDY
jgi:integrase